MTPSRVVVSGASGLIGSALTESLRADGVAVTRLVRREPRDADEVRWLDGARLDPAVLAGADAVVNLNGASIGRLPWTRGYRGELLWSRLTPTRTLARALRELGDDAPLLVNASAVGYYGSAPAAELTEASRPGSDFLAGLCVEWENAAAAAGSRVALLRTAPVVHPSGVLAPLMLLTRLGLSGPIGRGTQSWPWISLDDTIGAIRHILGRGLTGPVNLTGPTRASANDLGFTLAMRMNRPFVFRAPPPLLRAVLGRYAADALLLHDAHVVPDVLETTGYAFTHDTVADAIHAVIPSRAPASV